MHDWANPIKLVVVQLLLHNLGLNDDFKASNGITERMPSSLVNNKEFTVFLLYPYDMIRCSDQTHRQTNSLNSLNCTEYRQNY